MNFKPSDFFIGLVEFFSVLLPGFCVVYIVTLKVIIPKYLPCEPISWIYYAIGSYIVGHILYAFSGLWKKGLNNWLIIQFYSKHGWLRKVFTKMPEARGILLIEQAEKIKNECFKNESYHQDIKLYDWINIMMLKENAELTTITKRLEADSNFFRSFTIVCILTACFYYQDCLILASSILLFFFSLWRFVNRRFNAKEFASLYLIDKYKMKSEKISAEK